MNLPDRLAVPFITEKRFPSVETPQPHNHVEASRDNMLRIRAHSDTIDIALMTTEGTNFFVRS